MTTITIKQSLNLKKTEFDTIQDAIYHLAVLGLKKEKKKISSIDPEWIKQTTKNKAAYDDRKKSDYISFNQLKKKYGISD